MRPEAGRIGITAGCGMLGMTGAVCRRRETIGGSGRGPRGTNGRVFGLGIGPKIKEDRERERRDRERERPRMLLF